MYANRAPKHSTQAIKKSEHIVSAMMFSTNPAVAIPDGVFFLAEIPRIKPTIAAMIPNQAKLPKKRQSSAKMPSTREAIAIPSGCCEPGLLFSGGCCG